MGKVIIAPEAQLRLGGILNALSLRTPAAAGTLSQKIREILVLVGRFPEMGRFLPERPGSGLRELFVLKYRIVYRTRDDNVEVVTIFYGAMDANKVLHESGL
nr:type II toxin-antitoxin system RelE/ParE family toxin [Candidatus Sigynarchaeota archaeon]